MKYYKLALWKYYFEKGYSIMSYPKWVIAIFGIGEVVKKNYLIVCFGAFLFLILCILIGKWIWKSGFADAETEVSNVVNPFVKQVRKKLEIKKFK